MVDVIRECQKIAQELRSQVSRLRVTQVAASVIRDKARGVVDGYFRTDRPLFITEFGDASLFGGIDDLMQQLLRLAQGRSSRTRYVEVLTALDREWRDVEVRLIARARPLIGEPLRRPEQEAIAKTLEKVCPPSALCYRQALTDLDAGTRTSWRGTASELREALREALDTLAPDDAVAASPGFKLEANLTSPTMKQKARFILKSRRWSESKRKQMEDAVDIVDEKVGNFVRSVYGGSSSSVHTAPTKRDVQSVLRFVETCFVELLELE